MLEGYGERSQALCQATSRDSAENVDVGKRAGCMCGVGVSSLRGLTPEGGVWGFREGFWGLNLLC